MEFAEVVNIAFVAVFLAVLLGVLFAPPGGSWSKGLMSIAILLLVGYIVAIFYSAATDGPVFRAAKSMLLGRTSHPRPKTRRRGGETPRDDANVYIPIPRNDGAANTQSRAAPVEMLPPRAKKRVEATDDDSYDDMYDPHAAAWRLDTELQQRYSTRGLALKRTAHERFAASLNQGRMRADEYLIPIEDSSDNLFPH